MFSLVWGSLPQRLKQRLRLHQRLMPSRAVSSATSHIVLIGDHLYVNLCVILNRELLLKRTLQFILCLFLAIFYRLLETILYDLLINWRWKRQYILGFILLNLQRMIASQEGRDFLVGIFSISGLRMIVITLF